MKAITVVSERGDGVTMASFGAIVGTRAPRKHRECLKTYGKRPSADTQMRVALLFQRMTAEEVRCRLGVSKLTAALIGCGSQVTAGSLLLVEQRLAEAERE